MARARTFQSQTTSGEFSPRLDGRVDIARYGAALKTMENFVALPHGGAKRRTGTHHVAPVKTATDRVRLIPFEFSDTQAYVLEFGDLYLRFYMNGGQIQLPGGGAELVTNGTFNLNATGWTDASTGGASIFWDGGNGGTLRHGPGPSPSIGRSRQAVTVTALGTPHQFVFQVRTQAMQAKLGTTAGGAELLAAATYAIGTHTVSVTPTVSPVWIEFNTEPFPGGGYGDMDNVSLKSQIPYEIVTPYAAADLPRLKFVQSADVMYLVHPTYPVQKLTRTGHTAWTLIPVTFLPPPTAEELYKPAATLTPAATTGLNILFTASAAVFLAADVDRHIIFGASRAVIQTVDSTTTVHADILDAFPNTSAIPSQSWGLNGSPNTILTPNKKEPAGSVATLTATLAAFRSADVGKYVKLNDGIVKLTTFTSSTIVKGEIVKTLTAITASPAGTWTLEVQAWSATRGYPPAISFHEGRLVLAATDTQPQTVWGSASGDFENFALGTQAGDAYEFGIAANKVNIIRWLLPSRVLLVGTKGGEFRVSGGADLPITPTNVDAKSETAYGSNFVNPVRISSAILFVQRSGRKVRELAFSLDFDSYVAPDLTVLAEHIFPRGQTIEEMDFAQDPDPLLWLVRSDGLLCALSYDRSNDVVGWHRHPMDGAVESVCVIPHPDGDREQVWLSVRRTVDSATVRYIEYMDDSGGFYGDLHTDSTLTYTGAPATTFAGLEHLRGKVVQILGDGSYYGEQTVPLVGAAEVVITPAASDVEIGLPYVSTLETLRAEIQAQTGTAQGLKKRQAKVTVRFLDSMGMRINGEQQPARRSVDALGSAPPLFSGDKDGIKLGWNTEARNKIEQFLPFPCNVLGIFATLDVADY